HEQQHLEHDPASPPVVRRRGWGASEIMSAGTGRFQHPVAVGGGQGRLRVAAFRVAMSLTTTEIAHILLALGALLVAAHLCGSIFARFRQPRVIGEIIGGLLLGPTVLGAIAPGVQAWLFPPEGPT